MTSAPSSNATGFHCPNPNFTIKLVPSGEIFRVRKYRLTSGSNVFADMFGVCDDNDDGDGLEQEVEIHESPQLFGIFLRILHDDVEGIKDEPLVEDIADTEEQGEGSPEDVFGEARPTIPTTKVPERNLPPLIPYPILRRLFDLGDKYDVTPPISKVLESHLLRNTPDHPWEVYTYAWSIGLQTVAAQASAHLLSKPMHKYTMEEISQLPSLEAYHRLVLLHAYRVQRLQELLKTEEIFPHGYQKCLKHGDQTQQLWASRKMHASFAIKPDTDVAAEMALLKGSFAACKSCDAGCERAIAMLKYKCSKVPRTIDRLPKSM
ncbi:hypothetical protein FRC03_000110 [Tulasnella sp. 419]|nr:hypothetical protein FRC03_000110 [Tulasnella sp. 419]